MTRFEKALLMALVICFLAAAAGDFHAACDEIRQDTLRLHVLAASDSDADQRLKLRVRDALLQQAAPFLRLADSPEEAEQQLLALMPRLQKAAERALLQNGCSDEVNISIGHSDFDTRLYDGGALPAGRYRSLIVTIGEGQGSNWWCVLYPAICIGAASSEDALSCYSDSARTIVTSYGEYRVGFFLEEVYQRLLAYRSSAS